MSKPIIIGLSIALVVLLVFLFQSQMSGSGRGALRDGERVRGAGRSRVSEADTANDDDDATSNDEGEEEEEEDDMPERSSKGSSAAAASSSAGSAADVCYWEFVKYMPSKAESEWRSGIEANKENICGTLKGSFSWMNDAWLKAGPQLAPTTPAEKSDAEIAALCPASHHSEPMQMDETVFSHMMYRRVCRSPDGTVTHDASAEHKRVFIEPIGGTLRHPKICDDFQGFLFDKNYILVDGWMMKNTRSPSGRAFMFDAGASSWLDGNGGSSQLWLHHVYRDQCMDFDRYYAWELGKLDTASVFQQVPGPVRPKYHWFNIGINSDPASWDNPLNHIRQQVKPEDYVVFKLDIDNTPIETAIVQQLLESPDLHKLIDEFYWENHVDLQPLRGPWGHPPAQYTVAQSMERFVQLREKGIRSHSWT